MKNGKTIEERLSNLEEFARLHTEVDLKQEEHNSWMVAQRAKLKVLILKMGLQKPSYWASFHPSDDEVSRVMEKKNE